MASGELSTCMFCKKIILIGHNCEKITLGECWGLLVAILKPLFWSFGLSWGCLGGSWGGLGVVLGALGAVLGSLGAVLWRHGAAA